MELAHEAFEGLFPGRTPDRKMTVSYSGRFSGYNANVRYTAWTMDFRLSRQWRGVSRDIQIGLLQSLLQKVYRVRGSTVNLELYEIFLKKAHQGVVGRTADPELAESFARVNRAMFDGSVEMPSLKWGRSSLRKFGSYDYGSDTIVISSALQGQTELLDYVMHHEMLHKKLKYTTRNSRSLHHTAEFRRREKAYPESRMLERRLKTLPAKRPARRRGLFGIGFSRL